MPLPVGYTKEGLKKMLNAVHCCANKPAKARALSEGKSMVEALELAKAAGKKTKDWTDVAILRSTQGNRNNRCVIFL